MFSAVGPASVAQAAVCFIKSHHTGMSVMEEVASWAARGQSGDGTSKSPEDYG
jgi:hypothetical protein